MCQKPRGPTVVSDGLQDDPQSSDSERDVEEMSGEEEVVVVAQDGEDEVEQLVEEWLLDIRETTCQKVT